MTKLILNAANVGIFKNDAEFFGMFEKIVINAADATFSREAYSELTQQGLTVNAASINIIDLIGEPIDIGDAIIDGVADFSGKYLVGGKIRVTSKEALSGVTGMYADTIIAPEGTRFNFKVNGKICYYPEGSMVADEDIELSESYVAKLDGNAVLWTPRDVSVLDDSAAAAICARNITVCCRHLLITENAEQLYGKFFKADSREVIPDGCDYVRDSLTLSVFNAELYGDKLYIGGDLTVKTDASDALAKFRKIIVTGDAVIPYGVLPRWKEIGHAEKVTLYKGELWTVCGKASITHEQLEAANADGLKYTLVANGMLEFDAAVTKTDLDCFIAIYYNGMVKISSKVIPMFNTKVVEGNGMVTPIKSLEIGGDIAATDDNSGDSVTQIINVANFVRI